MSLTPAAKKLLAETIRGTAQAPEKGIRALLLRAIHDEADRRYRLSVSIHEAGLDEAHRRRRERLEAWIDERARATKPKNKSELKATNDRLLAQAEKEAAATLVNRLVLLRHLEALGLSRPAVVTGGWSSKGYRELREFAPTLCTNETTSGVVDATEGYAVLLQLVFDELAVELPGLFGDVGLTRLFAIPAATLREVVERLDDPGLASAWTDDTTLGWVYQYWNDPDREALDAKINGGGKIEPHEIASKTQMFTERYMVEWLLQNSLGLTWLAMCKKRGWTPDAERVLPVLDERRAAWRKKREAGEVALDALMPIEGELEERWKYYVPQPIPDDAVEKAPASVRSIKLLDPACGSGHFLVIAFDLLAALYREEARHLETKVFNEEIAESILENNLHGIDIDPRAVQIAAAGLYLKAKALSRSARPKTMHLVAPVLQLGSLPANDPAVVALKADLKREVGLPEELTTKLLSALAGVDYLGSLLKVDAAVEDALEAVELEVERPQGQGDLYTGYAPQQAKLPLGEAKASVLDKLEQFLAKRSRSDDLGLRLDGEQLAAGVRFVRMAKEGAYDLVVGNPPYQGISKTSAFGYVATTYPKGKADLYAAFLERGLGLLRPCGLCGMVTMQGWMFLGQFAALRRWVLEEHCLRSIADLMWCAFENMRHATVAMSILSRGPLPNIGAVALCPTPREEREESIPALARKRSALLLQVGRYEFNPRGFEVIEGEPLVYWWSEEFLEKYAAAPKLGDRAFVKNGANTGANGRLTRLWHEVGLSRGLLGSIHDCGNGAKSPWAPYVMGGQDRAWIEPLRTIIRWERKGLEAKLGVVHRLGETALSWKICSEDYYFQRGIAFSATGARFRARLHRYPGVFDMKGQSAFADSLPTLCCAMNSEIGRFVLQSLNPTISFQVGDAKRLPIFPVSSVEQIAETIAAAFGEHEARREPSFEFRQPGASAWLHAQEWAQRCVDRPDGAPLPPYEPTYEEPAPEAHVSFALGVLLGRFDRDGAGVLAERPAWLERQRLVFVTVDEGDSLATPYAHYSRILEAWSEHGERILPGVALRTYLRKHFFDFHKKLYENRPIYFPLSSAKRSFVAFVSIHRWADDTLSVLLADHLVPTRRRLEGELDDLRTARAAGTNKARAEKRFTEVQKLLEELDDFIAKVTEVAENGPPPPDDKTTKREVDARYVMDLDDGVMVNSAALWPLLEPQWKEPKKWWKELANAQGKKDYDWSHLAARYFSTRVRKKCHDDPSLAVAHKCFWELHPAKAYAWELRLQDEIRPDFTIDEPGSDEARAAFLKEHAREAREILAKELKRRERKNAKEDETDTGPLFDDASEHDASERDASGHDAEDPDA